MCMRRTAGSPRPFAEAEPSRAALREPAAPLLVSEDDGVLAAFEDDLEVAAVDRLLRPPAVDDAPLLAHDRDALVVHALRRPVERLLHPRGNRLVYSSRGTSSARASGIRDHGATSTTVQTEPEPVLARTWRSPSRRRVRSSAPAARSSSCCPLGSV